MAGEDAPGARLPELVALAGADAVVCEVLGGFSFAAVQVGPQETALSFREMCIRSFSGNFWKQLLFTDPRFCDLCLSVTVIKKQY